MVLHFCYLLTGQWNLHNFLLYVVDEWMWICMNSYDLSIVILRIAMRIPRNISNITLTPLTKFYILCLIMSCVSHQTAVLAIDSQTHLSHQIFSYHILYIPTLWAIDTPLPVVSWSLKGITRPSLWDDITVHLRMNDKKRKCIYSTKFHSDNCLISSSILCVNLQYAHQRGSLSKGT